MSSTVKPSDSQKQFNACKEQHNKRMQSDITNRYALCLTADAGRYGFKMKTICTLLLMTILSPPALAESGDAETSYNSFDFLAFGIRPDGDRAISNKGIGGREIYSWQLSETFRGEVQLFQSVLESDLPSQTDFYQQGAGFDVVYPLSHGENTTISVLGGLGIVRDDVLPDSEDSVNVFANFGPVLTSKLLTKDQIRIRAEIRYFYDGFNGGSSDYHYGVGISIPLGRERIVERVVEKTVYKTVIAQPEDGDQDGVPDEDDRCPNTIPGAKVGTDGCVIKKQTVRLSGVNFEHDSTRLTEDARYVLDGVVQFLHDQPELEVEIAGHTSSEGSDSYNFNLSRARAESVRSYLVRQGIDASRLSTRGYGETQPIDTNATEAGRAKNRRIEFRIIHARDE